MQQERNIYTNYAVEISCTGKSQGLAYLEHTGASPWEDYLQDVVSAKPLLQPILISTILAIKCYNLSYFNNTHGFNHWPALPGTSNITTELPWIWCLRWISTEDVHGTAMIFSNVTNISLLIKARELPSQLHFSFIITFFMLSIQPGTW